METIVNEIAIIVPMYNVEKYVKQCIESIKEQTYVNFKCVLIDDGSTDETLSIARSIVEKDPRFLIESITNSGPAAARNIGIEKTLSEYIMFVDSDDLLSENALELLINSITANENIDMVVGKTIRFNDQKKWPVTSHEKYKVTKEGIKNIADNPELFYAIGPAAKLFKRSLIGDMRFDEKITFAEDQLFSYHCYLNSKNIYTLDECVYFYRVREDESSLTQTYRKKILKNLDVLLNVMKDAQQLTSALQGKEEIIIAYYNRLFEIELRVLFKQNLLIKTQQQKEFFDIFNNFLLENKIKKIVMLSDNFFKYIVKEQLELCFLLNKYGVKSAAELFDIAMESSVEREKLTLKENKRIKLLNGKNTIKILFVRVNAFLRYIKKKIGRRNYV